MARVAEANLRLRAGLHQALPAQELELHYQPIVNCQTGELSGFEALLRWRSKDMGVIMPSDFIPVAEQTGMIVPIGEWVLREACREIGLLEDQLGRSFLLSVNLSPRQIQQHDLPATIRRALVEAGRPAHRVEFEITESMLMNDSDSTQNTLMQLREMGVRLAIDDFGIGFSSLSYITRFSIDRIKFDRSFVQKSSLEGSNIAVVRAMVAMAHGLSMAVVAEGVETAEEFHFLGLEGCDTAQGYYLSRPVPAAELVPLVNRLDDWAQDQSLTARAV
jgi:EAL domain-containing protein (putative c-di-GMP-specific phosphodiesterase class I)